MAIDNKPKYPITIYYKDTGNWVEGDIFNNEMELITGLEFADTDELDDNWAIKVIDSHNRRVGLEIEAIELIRFELMGSEKLDRKDRIKEKKCKNSGVEVPIFTLFFCFIIIVWVW